MFKKEQIRSQSQTEYDMYIALSTFGILTKKYVLLAFLSILIITDADVIFSILKSTNSSCQRKFIKIRKFKL